MTNARAISMQSHLSNQATSTSQVPPWERRIHPRFEVQSEAVVVDENWHTHDCWCGDISRGGACVLSRHPLSVGQTIEIWLKLSDPMHVECEAEVVRRERDRVGVRFIGLHPFQTLQFEKLLAAVQRMH
jgi:hypothetical protein